MLGAFKEKSKAPDSGLHFGEGPFDALSADPMGGPLVAADTQLMQAVIEHAQASPAENAG